MDIPPNASSKTKSTRRWLVPSIKILLAAALLYYVLSKDLIDFGRIEKLFVTPGLFLLALAAYSVQLLLGARRLSILLAPHGVHFSYWNMLRLTYLGAFFDVFSVTSVGGDAVKAFYLARETEHGRRLEAVSVLLLDRLMGLLGLLTLTLIVSFWQLEVLWNDTQIRPYLLGLFIVSGSLIAGMFLLFSAWFHEWKPVQRILNWLPFGKSLNRGYGALQKFRAHPVVLLEAWAYSLVVHASGVVAGYVLTVALGLHPAPPLGPFFVALLLSNFICSFAAFGGIGVGQTAFEAAFNSIAHIHGGANLATALQLTFILAKMPGLLAWLMTREHKTASS